MTIAPPPGAQLLPAVLPLFPLATVLFPGGQLRLKVFEARYLDMVSERLRSGEPFGVVQLIEGGEVHGAGSATARFEPVGTLAHLEEVDAEQAGILLVRCRGGQRFSLEGAPQQRADGLWLAPAALRWPREAAAAVPPELAEAARALQRAVESLAVQGQNPFTPPYRYDDAGWVANRWCELLPVSLAAKHRLMALDDAVLRLKLVDEFLRSKGVMSPR